MDNIKTGNIIREKRKVKGLTQRDVAEKLNITDRAVSKWERGLCAPDIALLEPLSEILEVSISDLISGELSQEKDRKLDVRIAETIDYSSKELSRKTAVLKRKLALVSVFACLMVILFIFSKFLPVIFQRGNPIPYLKAASRIDESHPYVEVGVNDTKLVYISNLQNNSTIEEMLKEYTDSIGFDFVEQNASSYFFTDGTNNLAIETEIYFGRYVVWTVPNVTYQH